MSELEITKKQRDILFDCLKSIAKSSNTPTSIRTLCNTAAKKAKEIINNEFPESLDNNVNINSSIDNSPLKVRRLCNI